MRRGRYDVRTRTPPRRRTSGRDYSPPRHRRGFSPVPPDRGYSPEIRRREYSPPPRGLEYSPVHQCSRGYEEQRPSSPSRYGLRLRGFSSVHVRRDRSMERSNVVGESSLPLRRGHHGVVEDVQSRTHPRVASGPADVLSVRDDLKMMGSDFSEESGMDSRGRKYQTNICRGGDGGEPLPTIFQLNEDLAGVASASTKFRWNHLLEEKRESLRLGSSADTRHLRNLGADYFTDPCTVSSERSYRCKEVLDTSAVDDSEEGRSFPGYLRASATSSDKHGSNAPLTKLCYDPISDGRFPGIETFTGVEIHKSSVKNDIPIARLTSQMKTYTPSPASVAKDAFLSYKDDRPLPSGGPSWSHGTGGTDHDSFAEIPPLRSSAGYPSNDLFHYRQTPHGSVEGVVGVSNCFVQQSNERSGMNSLPDKFYPGNMDNLGEKYGLQDPFRAIFLHDEVDKDRGSEIPMEEPLGETGLLDHLDYLTESSFLRGQNEFGSRSKRLQYETDRYLERKGLQLEGDNCLRNNNSLWHYRDSLKNVRLLEQNEGLHEKEWSHLQRFSVEDMGIVGESERIPERKRSMDDRLRNHFLEAEVYDNRTTTQMIHNPKYRDEGWVDEDDSVYDHSRLRKVRRTFEEEDIDRTDNYNNYLSDENLPFHRQGNSRKHVKSAARDIKKRLGPPQNFKFFVPWVKRNYHNRNPSDDESHIRERGDHFEASANLLEDVVGSAKMAPPEDSAEFKQLVHNAFLKYFRSLNDNAAKRRKYTDQGGSGTLKCGVCGSKSKEFVNTMALAMHAFMTRIAGCRVEHLGFHKALCVLMGWNSAAETNGAWIRQMLPHAEASALREDLIIWPPVVVLHNSSIANAILEDRLVINSEELQDVLKGMGFCTAISRVGRGKPANQSIMVVSYKPTLSGLLEAERLHKYFADNKHGRDEFELKSLGSRATGTTLADKLASVLYGYFGIAEDLEKLDFETKKRCMVKSKKEMQHVINALENG